MTDSEMSERCCEGDVVVAAVNGGCGVGGSDEALREEAVDSSEAGGGLLNTDSLPCNEDSIYN